MRMRTQGAEVECEGQLAKVISAGGLGVTATLGSRRHIKGEACIRVTETWSAFVEGVGAGRM